MGRRTNGPPEWTIAQNVLATCDLKRERQNPQVLNHKILQLIIGFGFMSTQHTQKRKLICTFYFKLLHIKVGSPVKIESPQGSTLTVVRLGIPSSFCCRTTWTYVYGCPLVKLRKLIKWIILDWSFISNSVNLTCSGLILAISIVFSVCSTEKKEWFTSYIRPFHID